MTETSWTEGPWFVSPTPGYLAMGQVHDGKHPITIRSNAHTEEIATVWTYLLPTESNANLIAAAPDLYEFADAALALFEVMYGGDKFRPTEAELDQLVATGRELLPRVRGERSRAMGNMKILENLSQDLRKIAGWLEEQGIVIGKLDWAVEELERLQAENEALRHDNEKLIQTSADLATENERLRELLKSARPLVRAPSDDPQYTRQFREQCRELAEAISRELSGRAALQGDE